MTLMGTVLVIVFILFIREEILSAHYRKEIKRAEKAYALSLKSDPEGDYAALPLPDEGAAAKLPPFSCHDETNGTFFDAA